MDSDTNILNELPKDARWVDLINKLRCPQCIGYRAWNIQQLERHVVLHCKSRPPLLRHHYIRELRGLTTQTNEDVLDLVRLALEAKLLQWRNENHFPAISSSLGPCATVGTFSQLLNLWCLWHSEINSACQTHSANDILDLLSEAESLLWDRKMEALPAVPVDDQIDKELIEKVQAKLARTRNRSLNLQDEIRLEKEAMLLSFD